MFAYCMLVSNGDHTYEHVRPGPDMEIDSISALRKQVHHDIGFVPRWLEELADPNEYIGVEDEHCIEGVWFVLDIEGSVNHVLPSVAYRIAYRRSHSRRSLHSKSLHY